MWIIERSLQEVKMKDLKKMTLFLVKSLSAGSELKR
jgi:hypothetical protein